MCCSSACCRPAPLPRSAPPSAIRASWGIGSRQGLWPELPASSSGPGQGQGNSCLVLPLPFPADIWSSTLPDPRRRTVAKLDNKTVFIYYLNRHLYTLLQNCRELQLILKITFWSANIVKSLCAITVYLQGSLLVIFNYYLDNITQSTEDMA